MKRKTIYYLPLYGQLGNQLSIMAHLIAFAKDYNYIVIFPDSPIMKDALDNSEILSGKFHLNRILSNNLVSRIANKLIRVIYLRENSQSKNLLIVNKRIDIDSINDILPFNSTVIITDWLFRYYSGVKNNAEFIREQLKFKKSARIKSVNFTNSVRNMYTDSNLVGVHVRRGDYSEWNDGKYYFDNDIYYSNMKALSLQLNCVFVICSNEQIKFENTDMLNIEYFSGTAIEDICVLSNCNYIFGPPSTFSGWASFIGKTPIYFLENNEINITIEKFLHNFVD